jgi:mono/diheme cytochrome c family protein
MRSILIIVAAAGAIVATAGSLEVKEQPKPPLITQAPEKYVRMVNPVADDPEAYAVGEKLFKAKCVRCHEPANEADRRAPSLAVPEVKNAPPGALYWVLEKGSSDMPSFARYPEKLRWHLVTYLQKRP